MEINELQELVLGNLNHQDDDGQVEDARSPLDWLSSGNTHNVSFDLFIDDIDQAISELAALPGEDVLYKIASLTARSRAVSTHLYSFPHNYIEMLFRAINYQQFGDQEDIVFLCEHLQEMKEAHIVNRQKRLAQEATGSKERIIDILEAVWGDDLQGNIIELTGVTKTTAKKWIGGANIGGSNFRRLQVVAKIFHSLREEKDYQREDLLTWYDAPLPSGQTPRAAFTLSSWWGCPDSVRQFMRDEGLAESL